MIVDSFKLISMINDEALKLGIPPEITCRLSFRVAEQIEDIMAKKSKGKMPGKSGKGKKC